MDLISFLNYSSSFVTFANTRGNNNRINNNFNNNNYNCSSNNKIMLIVALNVRNILAFWKACQALISFDFIKQNGIRIQNWNI